MVLLSIIKMYNLSPLHIGTGRDNYDSSSLELHSDTLSSALAAVGVATGMPLNVEEFLTSFSMSSAFPFYKDIYFLPKPQGLLNVVVEDAEESECRKKLKKVKYIEQNLWKQLLTGGKPCISKSQIQGSFIVPRNKHLEPLFKSQVMQRVTVPRDGSKDAEPFYFEWNYFNKDAGLYCLTDAKGDVLELMSRLFAQLGENGIGTDKNVGGGKFDVEIAKEPFSFDEPQDARRRMSLSLFIPTEEELNRLLDGSPRYSLLLRGGYMAGSSLEEFRHLRKKMVYAFGEGSVFETTKSLVGKVVNLRPDWNDKNVHPVYRSGRAVTLKIR
ncbi:MAG: type III-A CRISPR-associated RAMP protein Csm4 [Bacteroidales bacterium]|nr:type III-A CRISPR-associated RAMP protein Csm4 [Bacteroidales bacterium]MCM1147751.1 type III-A CRISPR-associated RAMP protein Csm4 [Bacteroidales bacterium]MCM1206639.1 type III-A CRISPR-associated RAMP protein Csm4 [Bacillota bacterium]MCM1510620.1 type III-A CRISPR-associated RAMP protein Csm4 [Clostridium sp.]